MKRNAKDSLIAATIRTATYFVVGVVGWIVWDVVQHGAPAISWKFLSAAPEKAGAEGGVFPAIVGTLCLALGTIIFALPLGVATALYLSEYSRNGRLARATRFAIVTLAGVPSVVFGLFGLGLFVIFLKFGTSILSGSLTLACMVLPTIIVASEEALRAVPQGLREGSLALGATKRQTICRNVLPYAIPGILTGTILSIGRAAGETAPILFTAAAFYLPHLPKSVFDPVMALPYHLFVLATQHPDPVKVRPLQYGSALTLLILVLGLNLIAILLRIRFRRKMQW